MIDAVVRLEWAHRVADCLAALPQQQAQALRQVYFEHASERETASALGVPALQARRVVIDGLRSLGRALLTE
ncbi:sigma factor-like helix-turn-helix DNA-binding protein [uncultured Jatrophihabitans sp.]|uniref:sigma factor-like helix-turn-helix DNA-binding protein n=1 Tax=uncultured Jatrophihabitans sp. TaxID=1610747 RepID=UPI0035CC9C29